MSNLKIGDRVASYRRTGADLLRVPGTIVGVTPSGMFSVRDDDTGKRRAHAGVYLEKLPESEAK